MHIWFRSMIAACLLATGASVGGMVSPAAAQSQIKAVVNSEPVTSNEINQRAKFLHLVARDAPNSLLQQQALEELVDEKLKFQEAKRHKIDANEAQVNGAFASIASRVKLSPQQLVQALGQSGIEAATLRTRLKAQIVWQQLVLARFRQSVSISDQEVVQALEKQAGKDTKTPAGQQTSEYTLQEIIFVTPASAGKGGLDSRAKEAEQFRAKVSGCDTIPEQLKAYKEVVVKKLGKRTEDELPGAFLLLVAQTPVGKATKPVPSPNGVEVLVVCEKRELAGDLVARNKVEENLRDQQGAVLARQYIQELRRFAVIEYK
jgi:peptidyl-prolyl cis-trans isomerase SurA